MIVRGRLDATLMTFLKFVTYRTIAPASLLPRALAKDRVRLWQNGNLVFNTIPIRSGAAIGISAAIATDNPPETLWSSTTAEEILSIYADFDSLIAQLIKGRIVEITTHPVYDKEPTETWADGHIVLLGDAAHPMAPMNGQGANQANRTPMHWPLPYAAVTVAIWHWRLRIISQSGAPRRRASKDCRASPRRR